MGKIWALKRIINVPFSGLFLNADSTNLFVFNVEFAGYFDISPTNNTLVVARSLDRESFGTAVVTVLATDQGGSGDTVCGTIS